MTLGVTARDWDELMPCERGDLLITASTFNQWVVDHYPIVTRMTALTPPTSRELLERHGIRVGKWWFFLQHMPPLSSDPNELIDGQPVYRQTWLPMWGQPEHLSEKPALVGRVGFDRDVIIPVLADDQMIPWMSPTPMELFSQRPGLDLARGHTLIGGLGLGWLAGKVMVKPGVTHVTIIEQDPDVANFFGRMLTERLGPEKMTLIVDDVYRHLFEGDRYRQYDALLLDIWRDFGDANGDQQFMKLRGLHDNTWGWGFARET